MALSLLDLAAAGAPPQANASSEFAKKPLSQPLSGAAAVATASGAPAFSFPGAVNILNSTNASEPADDERDDDWDSDFGDEDNRHEFVCQLAAKTDCDAMRRKIQRFLARKTMTQTAFLKAMSVNSNSYRHFMSYKGKFKGENNCTYDSALLFFHKLEKKEGAAVVSKRGAKPKGASATSDPKVPRKERNAQIQELVEKIEAVDLPEPVAVYDDCDEIRKKINEIIESGTMTQAALLRHLDVNSNSLRRFLTTKGKREGCSNGVYLRAYTFFEKMRIANGVAKTSKRVKMEAEMPNGYSLQRDPVGMWVFTGKGGF